MRLVRNVLILISKSKLKNLPTIFLERKSLLSAHFTITSLTKSQTVNIGHIRAYLTSLFGAEKKILEKEKEMVEKYHKDTENAKNTIEKLKNRYS